MYRVYVRLLGWNERRKSLQLAMNARVVKHEVETDLFSIYITKNDEYNEKLKDDSSEWFLYFKYYLEIEPINENVAPHNGGYSYRYFANSSSGYCSGQAYFLNYNLEKETGDGANDGVTLCNGYHYTYGNSFVVGMDKDGNLN